MTLLLEACQAISWRDLRPASNQSRVAATMCVHVSTMELPHHWGPSASRLNGSSTYAMIADHSSNMCWLRLPWSQCCCSRFCHKGGDRPHVGLLQCIALMPVPQKPRQSLCIQPPDEEGISAQQQSPIWWQWWRWCLIRVSPCITRSSLSTNGGGISTSGR